jgi:hypothetical protein
MRFFNIELYLKTTVVKICTLQCGMLMFSKRVPSNSIWGEYICNLSWTKKCRILCRFQLDENQFKRACLWRSWFKQIIYHLEASYTELHSHWQRSVENISINSLIPLNLLKPTGYVMHHQFNIQQLYALPTPYLWVLYLSENKQRLVPLTL